jgi:hypothetical protein
MPLSIRSDATFEPAAYREAIADMFAALGAHEQRMLVDRLGVLPRHIHGLAREGLIAVNHAKQPQKPIARSASPKR